MKIKMFCYLLPFISILLLTSISGCKEDSWHGMAVPVSVIFENHVYERTGEVVAREKAAQNVTYIGQAASEGQPLIEVTVSSEGYEVYAIKGIDYNTAIAVRIFLVGNKSAYYYYFKYERQD